MNDLVTEPDKSVPGADTFTGARALASAQALSQSESDLEKGLNGTVMALDILAMVVNPLKEFMMAGVGFLIEHVGPLRDFLDMLAGDPVSINATKDTWLNIQQAMDQAAADLVDDANSMSEWAGDAADAYRATIADFEAAIRAGASASGSIAKYMEVMGIWTAITRGLVLELICDFVSRAIMYALSALAASWFTFGGSFAAMISGIIADAMIVVSRIGAHIAKLGDAMQSLAARFPKLAGSLDDAGKAVSRFGNRTKVDFEAKSLGWDVKMYGHESRAMAAGRGEGPLGGGSMKGMQHDNQREIYDFLKDPVGTGKVPGGGKIPGADKVDGFYNQPVGVGGHQLPGGKSPVDIITGYPMTGFKGGLGGGPGALQHGGTEEANAEARADGEGGE